jgi:hypothetical protein
MSIIITYLLLNPCPGVPVNNAVTPGKDWAMDGSILPVKYMQRMTTGQNPWLLTKKSNVTGVVDFLARSPIIRHQ